ncbi:NHLP leader peptide family RiPP precursor [Paenibacillus sp. NPDC058071]|uniref:NHLP leader peptide family RiPP precursor n=1 Tax=Paenibacillus sp. NPDC058071 TaxID=3346326 RepID=UPI0036DEF3E8
MTNASLKEQLIEKAWNDEEFKQLLLTDPKLAIKDALGIDVPEHIVLKTLEESSYEMFIVLPQSPAKPTSDDITIKQEMW